MGVSGLLPFVKKACRKGNLIEYRGKCLAVDVSYLLHRGVFGCVGEIANGKGTDFYVRYVRKHVDILLKIECHVILVFDGQPLLAKKDINDSRRALREKNQKLGQKLLKEGLKAEAHRAFQQGITITRDIVENTIRAFQNVPMVDVIVAPYEADAQIAFLLQHNLAYAAVTEDSDLIVFGCERIIFKMDLSGSCLIYDKSKLASCVCPAIERRFEFEIFRRICILAGCDYLQGGLQGIGLKKAEIFFTKTTQTDLKVILPRLPLYLNMSSVKVDMLFIEEFIKAENTFLYQIVFDPITRKHTSLNPYPAINDNATEISPPGEAFRRALGNVDFSRAPVQDEFVLKITPPDWSIWSGERYLKIQTSARIQRERTAYEKFGAFAPKQSPKRVHRNTTFKCSLSTNASIKMAKKRIPLVDIDDEKENNAYQDEDIDENCLVFRKRKVQRRSEPMKILTGDRTVKNLAHTRQNLTQTTQNNGSTLKWSSNEWMKLYGALIVSKPSVSQLATDTVLSDSVPTEDDALLNPVLNLFSKKDSLETVKNSRNVDGSVSDSIDVVTKSTIKDVKSCVISQRNQFQKQERCRIGLRQLQRPLLDTSASSTSQSSSVEICSSGSISSSGVSSQQSPYFNSQTSSSNMMNTASPIVSQEVFYRRRSHSSQNGQLLTSPILSDGFVNNCSSISKSVDAENCFANNQNDISRRLSSDVNINLESDEGKGDSCPNDNHEPTNKENNLPIYNSEKVEIALVNIDKLVTMDVPNVPCVSPYFLNNKLANATKIGTSGYRPSGLRRRVAPANSFPRVL